MLMHPPTAACRQAIRQLTLLPPAAAAPAAFLAVATSLLQPHAAQPPALCPTARRVPALPLPQPGSLPRPAVPAAQPQARCRQPLPRWPGARPCREQPSAVCVPRASKPGGLQPRPLQPAALPSAQPRPIGPNCQAP